MIEKIGLLRIELVFDEEKEAMGVEHSATQIFTDMIETTNSQNRLKEALTKIENILEELMKNAEREMEEIENV